MDGISIIICCYNSVTRISPTLQHLASQRTCNQLSWEVLLIDNASTDNTAQTAIQLWESFNSKIPLRIINEPRPGLSFARETGLQDSHYNIAIFVDDDNWLKEDYIQIAYNTINANKGIGILGGRVEAACEIEPPAWFEKSKAHYVIGEPYSQTGDVTEDRATIYGAGMVINKAAWKKLKASGYKSQLSDRKGSQLSSGGDVELCFALKMLGYRIYYHKDLVLKHFLPKARLSWNYLEKLFPGFALAEIYLNCFQYFYSNSYSEDNYKHTIYKEFRKKVCDKLFNQKRNLVYLYLKGVPEGNRHFLYLKFYVVQLKFLMLHKKTFYAYLNYLNSFKKQISESTGR
ncbi:glycosyltransferase [Cytophagaceae bacterium YF14B1]|uniref:Glycosyltransferase n=1 Tax=Xanthocytophaga flava TaxID=3048013 RepID=A0AAE3U796_9BACT|nr:glycosyltransferase [Xanthocytophaga flavus]MDJ1482161.1 glycosyltransferase [Xanthocytophaga flavus]